MNIFNAFAADLQAILAQLPQTSALSLESRLRATVEPPRDASHGDLSTNAAMVLAKEAGLKPRDLAEAILQPLQAGGRFEKVEIAGPGFINLTLNRATFSAVLRAALKSGPDFGRGDLGQGRKINVEFVSANPTGPMHIGHGRGAVYGDALAKILEFIGFDVCKEYYINDAGAQVDIWRIPPIIAIVKLWDARLGRSARGFIRAIISFPWVRRWPPDMASTLQRCRNPIGSRWCATPPLAR
jgi:arginyl-tRNA synthetase